MVSKQKMLFFWFQYKNVPSQTGRPRHPLTKKRTSVKACPRQSSCRFQQVELFRRVHSKCPQSLKVQLPCLPPRVLSSHQSHRVQSLQSTRVQSSRQMFRRWLKSKQLCNMFQISTAYVVPVFHRTDMFSFSLSNHCGRYYKLQFKIFYFGDK